MARGMACDSGDGAAAVVIVTMLTDGDTSAMCGPHWADFVLSMAAALSGDGTIRGIEPDTAEPATADVDAPIDLYPADTGSRMPAGGPEQ